MNQFDPELLKALCTIHSPSGNESGMKEFLLDYIYRNCANWAIKTEIIRGPDFQNCVVLIFGKPSTAVFAHIDSIGFTVGYDNNLIRIGGPKVANGYILTGNDSTGAVECTIESDEETGKMKAAYQRIIDPGTDLTFKCNFRLDENYVQSCYLDNRLGVYIALQLASTLRNGAIVFSCWEEHGGGTAGYLAGYLYKKFQIRQALICDITWVTEGVHHGKGVAVSMRDAGIPRRIFVNRIREILEKNKIKYQLEVESAGGSDGSEIQKSPFPIEWCFIGAPEDGVHSPDEKVHLDDIRSMLEAYGMLTEKL